MHGGCRLGSVGAGHAQGGDRAARAVGGRCAPARTARRHLQEAWLVLDIFGTAGGGDTLQAVISGSADLTVGIGTAAVLRAYFKGAPIRVIGANFTGAGDLYWYVRADSPIKRLTDASDKTTIGYSASGSSSHNVVLAFLQELGVKAMPTATGTQPATLTQVMSGQIDI